MSKVLAHEEITVDAAVKSLDPTIYSPASGSAATYATVHAEGGDMRYFVNSQNPTPSSGVLIESGDIIELPSIYHIKDFRVVKVNSASGKLTVVYEG